MKWFNR